MKRGAEEVWVRRTEICYSCRFWLGGGIRERGPKGQCRRFPPVVTDRAPQGSFPTTDSTDWCGEWQRLAQSAQGTVSGVQQRGTEGTIYDEL